MRKAGSTETRIRHAGKLLCPKCKHPHSSVIDSRGNPNGTNIRRRRACEKCDFRFTSYEMTDATTLNGNDTVADVIEFIKDVQQVLADYVESLEAIQDTAAKAADGRHPFTAPRPRLLKNRKKTA